ncbi:FtsP/CotA-like multicopper oxidase with cupredoxin domain [Microbacterium trichothecenolyticum]|uniref:multicopper oxidase family protein n=1 Tax=Microbacterium trichothecenolyticum TaxID=69370 RepID=UPI00285AC2B8|nr:multicopper oxidase domain-containing protein [Microbacterium trichothecenolyticum]MDR7187173.1 FtsP/CotA-like multicopper oxidase with cupredoxin domain [Microbacterium trichothecenolyticum]
MTSRTGLAQPGAHRAGWRRGRALGPVMLLGAALVTIGTAFTACTIDSGVFSDNSVLTPKTPPAFDTPLPIPPLAESQVVDGVRVFSLTAQEGRMQFFEGMTTPTWGFNGDYLGPTLRADRGEKVAVEVSNELTEATTVHWHGMHLPAAMDGGPHQPIEPGRGWRPEWQIDQPAATLWYHPHPHGQTEEHVMRGLAGMFILDDGESDSFGLPAEYGVDDIPLIVQDKKFRSDGQFQLDSQGNEVGLLGNVVLTNGAWGSVLDVITEQVRLRILNGSSARTYDFVLEDGSDFALVASDGGLLEAPVVTDHVRLSPGERAEIVVRMAPGTQTMLRSVPPDLGNVAVPAAYGGTDNFDVLLLRAAAELRPSPVIASRFTAIERFTESDVDNTRTFAVQNREINGRRMDVNRIDEVVQVDSTELWEVTNRDLFPHNWHVHDVQFQVLDIDGEQPPPELLGWKDTIYLEPRKVYRIVMRFEDYVDDDKPYMIHCHLLLHEDEGLMSQFVVSTDEPRRNLDDGDPIGGHGH